MRVRLATVMADKIVPGRNVQVTDFHRSIITSDDSFGVISFRTTIAWALAADYIYSVKNYQEFEINYFQDEDGMFTAEVPAIRGCVAWGKTLIEAYRNAIDAIESCLEAREMVAAKKIRKPRYAGLNIYRRPVHA